MKHIVVYGQIANQLVKDNDNKFKMSKFENLKQSFDFACSIALSNDTILLSPATASYDQYTSYIERGKEFNNLVKDYEADAKKK